MKKLITLVLCMSASFIASADIWTITRSHCFLQKRYIANARVSAIGYTTYQTGYNTLGQWVGKNPKASYYSMCESSDGGCTRPRTAHCQKSGYINDITYSGPYGIITGSSPYWGNARITLQVGGGHTNVIRVYSGRGLAGTMNMQELDSAKAASLVSEGWSSAYTQGKVEVDDSGNLKASGISGTLFISKNTDHFSLLRVMIIKERDDLTDTEAAEAEERMKNGDFGNVVYSGEIRVDRRGVHKTGLFTLLSNEQGIVSSNDDSTGITLNNFNYAEKLSVPLDAHEHLSAVFFSDGGFDVSSAIMSSPQARMAAPTAPHTLNTNVVASFEPELIPNPVTTGVINVRVFSEVEQEAITIEASDVVGKTYQLYKGSSIKGANELRSIPVSHLPAGIYFGKIVIGNQVFTRKFVVQ